MPLTLSFHRANEYLLPLRVVLIDKKRAGLNVPAWPFLGVSFAALVPIFFVLKKYFTHLIPPCGLHEMTGLPCPTCGFTRMIFYLLEFDFKEAFLVQPLLFLVAMFFIVWITAGLVSYIFGKIMLIEVTPFWRKFLWVPLVALFLLNWLYLFKRGV